MSYMLRTITIAAMLLGTAACNSIDEPSVPTSCEDQSVQECECVVLSGSPYNSSGECFLEPQPYRCTEDANRPGAFTYARDPNGVCWLFGFILNDGKDNYDFTDIEPGWTIIEAPEKEECFMKSSCE